MASHVDRSIQQPLDKSNVSNSIGLFLFVVMTAKYNQSFPPLIIIFLVGTHPWIICNIDNSLRYDAPLIITKTLHLPSPVKLASGPCIFVCMRRLLDELKSLPQISHLNGSSLLCVFMCFFRIWCVSNRNLQPGRLQTWSSRPLCQRMCALSWSGNLNALSHPGSWHLTPKLSSCTQHNFHIRGKA
jgi:hypothetical protein